VIRNPEAAYETSRAKCGELIPALDYIGSSDVGSSDADKRTVRRRNAHRYFTRHSWLTVTLWGRDIVRLADAKIVAWSMHAAALLTKILSTQNVIASEAK
jgi:hypothetical protein